VLAIGAIAVAAATGCTHPALDRARDIARSPPPADIRWWWHTERLVRECMAAEGFIDYAITPEGNETSGPHSAEEWLATVSRAQRDQARAALFGDDAVREGGSEPPKDGALWVHTGCYGEALHRMGVD
jgi:hypothetical protein